MAKYTAEELKNWSILRDRRGGRGFLPARPLRRNSLLSRIKHAWGVLSGRYDAIDWEEH